MNQIVQDAYMVDRAGSSVLEFLLHDRNATAPLLPEVGRNEMIATAAWYVWWERRKAIHNEPVQKPIKSAQAISVLTLNKKRERKVLVLNAMDGNCLWRVT